ncbi:MAG: Holliday junction resolvase RuvX [Anaerolineae bacterium]|jgi:putative Holliday junction resolvase
MRLLALDVGGRQMGVAISDETGLIATPVSIIERRSKAEDFSEIAQLVRDWGVEGLVIGHPLNDDGTSGPQAQRIERYAAELVEALRAEGLDVPSTLWDEYGSTQRAEEIMIASGRTAEERRTRIDAVAAAVILQDYLDAQRTMASIPVEEEDV